MYFSIHVIKRMKYFILLWACETRSQCVSLAPLRAPHSLHSIVFRMLLRPRNHWSLCICFTDNVGYRGRKRMKYFIISCPRNHWSLCICFTDNVSFESGPQNIPCLWKCFEDRLQKHHWTSKQPPSMWKSPQHLLYIYIYTSGSVESNKPKLRTNPNFEQI